LEFSKPHKTIISPGQQSPFMRVYLESYGCTLNHGESRIIGEQLRHAGHILVASESDADLVVLSTCVVIDATERKMVKRIAELHRNRKPFVVSGCMASLSELAIKEVAPEAIVLPPDRLNEAVLAIDEIPFSAAGGVLRGPTPEAIIPIAQGCLGSCTYCITRLARGKLKSVPRDEILRMVERAVISGHREIQLTAQDSGAYGMDIGTDLPALLDAVCEIDGEFRVRVGMLNPNHALPLLDKLLDAYEDDKLFKFLHLPVQSGHDGILKAMGRKYKVEDFKKIVSAFRSKYPDMTLATDVILGYPGEGAEEYAATRSLIEGVRPDIVNVTRFSARPGTPAFDLKPTVHGRQVKEWSRELTKLRFKISRENNERFVGRTERVLTTECGKGDTTMARTQGYRAVVIEEELRIGEFMDVVIERAEDCYLVGRRV